MSSKKKQQQSMSKISVQGHAGAGAKSAEQTSLEHLGSIFKGKIDSSVVEIVFYEHNQNCEYSLLVRECNEMVTVVCLPQLMQRWRACCR